MRAENIHQHSTLSKDFSRLIIQIALTILSLISVWLSQDESITKRKYACVFGLAAQPFWGYTAFIHGQWGIFFLCFVYTAAWVKGLYVYWYKPKSKARQFRKEARFNDSIERAWDKSIDITQKETEA